MRRRGFIAGLLALPFVAPIARAAAKVKARLFPVVYLGLKDGSPEGAATLGEAFAKVKPGGMIVCMPGEYEFTGTEESPGDLTVIGSVERPAFRWKS